MRLLRLTSYLFSCCLLAGGAARAQSPTPAPTSVPAAAPAAHATNLAVEIVHHDGRRGYVAGNKSVWFVRFGRVAGWQQPAHVPPVRAVQVASSPEGGGALTLTVSVRLGVQYHDEVRAVATFVAREGEGLTVEGLREFGVVPVALKVVRVRPAARTPPYVECALRSLELLGVEPVDELYPSYKVRLRNLSGKAITAMKVFQITENGRPGVQMAHKPQNEPLAAAGGVYELRVAGGNAGQMTPDGYVPDSVRTVQIKTVVFADGTFEGDEAPAAEFNALARGRKVQVGRALPILRRAVEVPEAAGAVERFRSQVSALGETAADADYAPLLAQFPQLGDGPKREMRGAFEFSLHKVKQDLLDALNKFEAAHRDDPGRVTFKQWLEGVRGMYEQWLARL